MKPVSPVIPVTNIKEVIVAKNQEQYQNLPVIFCDDPEKTAVCRWELSDLEIEKLKETKSIYCYIWTFGKSFNPMLLTVETPELEINTGE